MKFLRTFIEKGILFSFVLCFAFISLYVPQKFNQVAEAGGGVGNATEFTQILNNVELGYVNAATSISAAADPITSAMTSASFVLDNVTDGIFWALAKSIVSQMTASIVNWINTGFDGSPRFVSDMKGFLLEAGDVAFGDYLEELGGPFSFICAPFQLDVKVAVAITYEKTRANAGQLDPGACTLTGALANLEGFIDGTKTFVDGGGWDNWFSITANPTQYTPLGNMVKADATASAKIVNQRGEEINLATWSDGFLSTKVCENVGGAGSARQDCKVTTPGKVVSEALTFQTSTGQRSLIEADEINEILTAAFSQLTEQAIMGSMGLLGLSGGTGYTYTGVPFTDQLGSAGVTSDPQELLSLIDEAVDIEYLYLDLAEMYLPLLEDYANDTNNPDENRLRAFEAANDINFLLLDLKGLANDGLISILEAQQTDLEAIIAASGGSGLYDANAIKPIASEFFSLKKHTQVEVDGKEIGWKKILGR